MERPDVSVITPAHNVAPWIEAAVRSALAQDLQNMEYVVVDDGSTDSTTSIVEGIRDPRLRLVRQQRGGVSAARNAGVRATSGEYVAFLDGDDVWEPSKLARQVEILNAHPEVDWTFSWSRIIDERGEPIGHTMEGPAGVTGFAGVVEDVIGNGSTVVMRRKALADAGMFDESLKAASDYDMWLRLALLRPANGWCVAEPLTLYRRREGQTTRNWKLSREQTQIVIEKIRRVHPEAAPHLARAAAVNDRGYAFMAYDAGEPFASLKLLTRSAARTPAQSLGDRKLWSIAAAAAARLVLPKRTFEWLRQRTRRATTHTLIA